MSNQSANVNRSFYLVMLLVPLFWGGAFGAGKHILQELPPFTTATLRFGLAGVVLVPLLLWRREWNFSLVRQRWRGLLILAFTGVFTYNLFFFLGLQHTSATNASLVVAINPALTTLFAVLLLGEARSKRLAAGLLLSLIGVIVVITKGSWETLTQLSFNKGDLFMFGSVFSWVIFSLVGKVVMQGVPPLLTTTVTTIAGAFLLFLASLTESGWSQVPHLSGQIYTELIYVSVLGTVGANLLYNVGVHRIGASKASAFINLVPINAAWIAALFYDEQIGLYQLLGMLLVITGVLLTSNSPGKSASQKSDTAA